MRHYVYPLSLVALSMAHAGSAYAEDAANPAAEPANGKRTLVYEAAFFSQYSPRSALDIARRVPGFALELGNADTRGFAGAAGNVVINGSRPSSKAETLETTLARIPAQRVARVEVGPGDAYGAEYSTRSQVLNVILSAKGGLDGTVTASARRVYTGRIIPDINGSALIRKGDSTINLSAGTANTLFVEEGTDTLTDPSDDSLIELRRKVTVLHDLYPFVSGSWALEHANDKAFRLNARWSPGKFHVSQQNHVTPAGESERDDDLVQDFKNPLFELGGDVTRPLAGGAIKLVGLATRRKRDWLERYRFRSEGGTQILGGTLQLQDAKRNESILRLNWTRASLAGFSVEAGVEGALNTLDHQVQLFEILDGGDQNQIDLPVDQAKVKERRGEGFARAGRQLSTTLRLDAGINFEYSDLKVTGDAQANRTLKFWKPSVTLDWKEESGWHGQLSVRRTVAQLDFYDFISSAELGSDRVNAGNPDLAPQQSWEFRGTIERPILGDGLARFEVGYDLINDLQDHILIFDEDGNGFDAPGNIGKGRRSFAKLTLDAPLTGLGLTGVRAKFDGQLQRTRVDDPISGEPRNFSGQFPNWSWTIDVRRDSGKFSYGFNIEDHDKITYFRTDEFDSEFNVGIYGTAFVEYRPWNGTTITLDVDNAFHTFERNRQLFIPNRAQPSTEINEFRERNRHLNFGFALKQSFGGDRRGPVKVS
jgi:hypothetical protein